MALSSVSEMSSSVEFGDYILDRSLGNGATGKVKLARNKTTGEQVAVKIIKKELFQDHPDLLKRVQREVALMRLLSHPNILPLHDVFESEHHIFIVEGYAPNGSLYDRIHALTKMMSIAIFRQIIYGLEYLHQHRICHRDLKPENILIDSADQVWIADFGFACWMPNNVANTSCGSPLYSAPEIIRGVPYDGRIADVWSAGVILYAMLNVQLPFYGDSVRAIAQKIKKGCYQMPTNLEPIFQDLIRRILVVDPAKRLTIAQIKEHPAFRIGLEHTYSLPTPLPLPHLEKPIEPTEEDTPHLEILQQVGFMDIDELEKQLASDSPNMAKVFFCMLTQRSDMSALPWDDHESIDTMMFDDHSFAADGQAALFQSIMNFGSPSSGSFCESMKNVTTMVPDSVLAQPFTSDDTIQDLQTDAVRLMALLQNFLRLRHFQFLFPDDRTLYARSQALDASFCFSARYETPEVMHLSVHQITGNYDHFSGMMSMLRQLLHNLDE